MDIAEKDLRLALAERDKILIGVDAHEVEAARRQVELLGEQLRYRRKEHDRADALRGKGMLSPSDYDRTFTEMAQCETALLQARAELRHLEQFVRHEDRALAEARVAAARSRLNLAMRHEQDTILAAPCDGTVCEILKHEGEACRMIDPEPALVFGDLTRLRVRAEIHEHDVAKIRSGQSAVIYRRAGWRSHQGHVISLKAIMGRKTTFSRAAAERKDVDVLRVLIETDERLDAPIGLEVHVKIDDDPDALVEISGTRTESRERTRTAARN